MIAKPTPNLNEIRRAMEVIIGQGHGRVVEVRAFGTPKGTYSGLYNSGALAQDVFDLSSRESTPAVFWTLQEINPELLKAGHENQLYAGVIEATKDEDVLRYLWLPIDCDPVRDAGVSSTEEEKAESESVAWDVRRFLKGLNYPTILADSGNGYHDLLPLNIANVNGTSHLVEKVLKALNARFGNKHVNIDTKVANPSRILKIYGSVARKGEHIDERPWRTSGLVDVPDNLKPLDEDQLKNLLAVLIKDLPPEKIAEVNTAAPKKAEEKGGERILIRHGSIYDAVLSQCGKLWNNGFPPEDIGDMLVSWAHANCEPPIDEAKVRSYAKGSNWVQGQPGAEWVYFAPPDAPTLVPDSIGVTENGIPIFAYPKDEDESLEDVMSIAALENKGDITVEYPDPGVDDLVSLFATQLVSGTSLPLAFARETLKNLTNQLIDGYYLHPVRPELSLRGFHINLGDSFIGKTTAFDWVLGWMKPEFQKREIWMRDLLSYGSRQFLVRMLSSDVPLNKDGTPKWKAGNPLQFLHVKEGNRIAADGLDKYFKSIFSVLTDLYDQTEASTGSFSNDEWVATGVKVGSIINITPTDFRTTFEGKGSIGGGGLPRWTIAAPPKVENKKDWVRLPLHQLGATFKLLTDRLPRVGEKMLASNPVEVTTQPIVLTEEEGAKEIRLATHNRMEEAGKRGVRLTEYFIREQVNRAVFSLTHPNVMTAADAERIAAWTDAQLAARANWPVDAGNPVERNEVTIRRTVIRHLVSEAKLKDACHYYREGSGGAWAFSTARANLLKEGEIKCVGVAGQRHTPVFCPIWCKDHPRIKI